MPLQDQGSPQGSLDSSGIKKNSIEVTTNTEMTGDFDDTAFMIEPRTSRTPPPLPTEEVLLQPPLTEPVQSITNGMGPMGAPNNVQWAHQNEGYGLTNESCDDDGTKMVQANLVEWFQTQRARNCCFQRCNGRRPRLRCCGCPIGGGVRQQLPCCTACCTPCCCQRCRVYNYCFNILNRHNLQPCGDDKFVGNSQFETNASNNSIRRQQQASNYASVQPSANILNSGQGDRMYSLMNRPIRTMSGARNWASPPDGYEDTGPPTRGQSQYGQYPPAPGSSTGARPFAGGQCPVEAMLNHWKTEYTSQFIDFSDQIRTSAQNPDYDYGFGRRSGGRKGFGCAGGCGQQGKQMRMSSCFDTTNRNGGGGNYGESLN